MTRMPELERALVEAGHRRYGRPAWRRAIVPAGAAGVAIASLLFTVSLGEPEIERAAVPLEVSAGELQLPKGEPVTDAQTQHIERYGEKVTAEAFALPAPPIPPESLGSDADEWLVIPRGDSICLWRGGNSICGSRASVGERGAIASILPGPDSPLEIAPGRSGTLKPEEAIGSGPATMWGLVPPEFVQVRAPAADVSADVRGQLFDLTVPSADDLDGVVLVRRDGTSVPVGGDPAQTPLPSSDPAPSLTAREAAEAFAVLRDDDRIERLPDDARPLLRNSEVSTGYLVRSDSRGDIYVVVDTEVDAICNLYVGRGDGTSGYGCRPPAEFAAGRASATSVVGASDGLVIYAILPDGTSDVRLDYVDGSTERVDIEDNVAHVVPTRAPERLSWSTPSGERINSHPTGANSYFEDR